MKLWGSGAPRREFLHSDDLADSCVFIMENVDFKDMVNTKKNGGNGNGNRDCPEDDDEDEYEEDFEDLDDF